LVGHPDGFIDSENLSPIVQQCITATHIRHNFQGEQEFVIDKPIFGGASGSPVFVIHGGKPYLAGIVYAGRDPDSIPMVGHCIKSSVLDQFEPLWREYQNSFVG